MTPAQLEDLRRFANEGFPAVGRLLDAYESAQAELAAVRGGVVLEDLTETEIEAVWARVRTYDYQHRSMAQRFVDELNEEIRTRLRSAPEWNVLVDAGALAVLEEKLNMARRWGYGTRHQWRYCRTESVFPNGMADLVPMIDALRASQRPGQGGKGGEG